MKQISSRLKKAALVLVFLILFISLFFIGSVFTVVDAGTVGVLSTFGEVSDNYFKPGVHLKNPFTKVIEMNTRTASYTMSETPSEGEAEGDDSVQALASDGGLVWFDVTVLYRLNPEAAPEVYSELGLLYQENIIRPEIRSVIRAVASGYPVNELYSTKRSEVQNQIFEDLEASFDERGIKVEEVLLRKVNISNTLSDSIELKLSAEQDVERQEFEIQKAEKEADKKRAEAKGQRDAQEIINESLTSKYLYYLYVSSLQYREGTIYVPVDPENGMPLFKNIE